MAHLRAALGSRGPVSDSGLQGRPTGPCDAGYRPAGCSLLQPMWRWTFSAADGPGPAGAIQGPGIDGSMMPASSHE